MVWIKIKGFLKTVRCVRNARHFEIDTSQIVMGIRQARIYGNGKCATGDGFFKLAYILQDNTQVAMG